MIVIFFGDMLVFHCVVVIVGNRHHAVKKLNDDYCDEEADVLFEIKKYGLPRNGYASF